MKKRFSILALLLALSLLFTAIPFTAGLADEETDALTAEPWVNASSIRFTVNADGTCDYEAGNLTLNGTWTYNAPDFVFTYELYGTRTLELQLGNKDGSWPLTNADGALFMHESEFAAAQEAANAGVSGYALTFGEPVVLPFVKFTIDKAEIADLVGGERGYYPAPEGYRLFVLRGTIENLFNGELKVGALRSQFTLNDQYIYNGEIRLYTPAGLDSKLQPMTTADLTIYAQIPVAMAEQLTKADVVFSFNDNFASAPTFVADGMYIFQITVDEEQTSAAKAGPAYERKTFEECPILPTPESFSSVFQSGSSKSSSNGKVTKIKYTFKFRGKNESIEDLRTLYLGKLEEEGFTVKDSGAEAAVSWGKKKIATITISGDSMTIDIVPGNENLTGGTPEEATAEEEAKVYKPGETVKANTAEIVLEKKYTTGKKVFSNKTGKGRYYYYEAESDPFFIIYGTFKNTGKVPVDVFNIYAAIIIDDEYMYRADVRGVGKNATSFISDVSAQGSTECVIHGEVPSSVLKKAKSIVIRLGFTDDFSTKVVSSGSLPLFERCDQVFDIKIK